MQIYLNILLKADKKKTYKNLIQKQINIFLNCLLWKHLELTLTKKT